MTVAILRSGHTQLLGILPDSRQWCLSIRYYAHLGVGFYFTYVCAKCQFVFIYKTVYDMFLFVSYFIVFCKLGTI